MDENSFATLKAKWIALVEQLSNQFDQELDLQGIIFLIGVQELGKGYRNFSKDEKQDLMHIATCRLLSRHDYYEFEGNDKEGWPHWRLKKAVPPMSLKEQDIMLKQCVLDYFEENKLDDPEE